MISAASRLQKETAPAFGASAIFHPNYILGWY
jgi:hypothetical protein